MMQPLYDIKGKNADTTVGNLVFKDYDGFYTVDYFSKLLYFKPELRLKDKVVQYVTKILDTTTDSSLREKYNYFIDTLARISNS